MPYLNKRNRFISAAKQFSDTNGLGGHFKKSDLLAVAQSINMKGIPTWVLKEYRSAVNHGQYDLSSLLAPTVPTTV